MTSLASYWKAGGCVLLTNFSWKAMHTTFHVWGKYWWNELHGMHFQLNFIKHLWEMGMFFPAPLRYRERGTVFLLWRGGLYREIGKSQQSWNQSLCVTGVHTWYDTDSVRPFQLGLWHEWNKQFFFLRDSCSPSSLITHHSDWLQQRMLIAT